MDSQIWSTMDVWGCCCHPYHHYHHWPNFLFCFSNFSLLNAKRIWWSYICISIHVLNCQYYYSLVQCVFFPLNVYLFLLQYMLIIIGASKLQCPLLLVVEIVILKSYYYGNCNTIPSLNIAHWGQRRNKLVCGICIASWTMGMFIVC